ncbi:MAG: hypothetical protein H6722_10400 [Sandaracinus sp.]|nr:hypothetical protein [Sandaracinus sp.]MCB9618169.1 hypothetical protein [Sandaracinus sp.]
MLRFVRAWALAVALVSGCSHSPAVPVDAGPLPDGATEATRRLELDTPRALTLRTGEEASIVVRYLDAEGRALPGESVRFVLDGVAHDTTLARIDDLADAMGRAEATLVAGATAAAFRVRVSAELATPVSIDVAVSDAGFGELEVELDYAGDREDGVLAAAVFAGGDCDEARALSERGDRYRLRGPDDDVVRFVALPADLTYAVVGRLEGSSSAVGWGCVDGVTVSPEAPSRVRVEVDDLPIVVDGDYDATLTFDAPITAEATADELRAFGAAFLSPDPTSVVLDAMERQLLALGDEEGLDALALARDADLELRYAAALESANVGPQAALDALAELVESRLAHLELGGTFSIVEGEAALRFVRMRAGTDDVTEASLGAAFALQGSAGLDASGMLTDFRLGLPLDRVVAHVLTTEASALGLTRREEWVVGAASCARMPALPDLDVCDATCRELACREVTTLLWAGLDLQLSAVTPSRTSLTLVGALDGEITAGEREVSTWSGALEGSWGSAAAVSPEPLVVDVVATRVIP